METKIIKLPKLKLLGIPMLVNLQDGGFGKAWELLGRYNQEVSWKNQNGYGVEIYCEELKCDNKWFYMAAMEVNDFDEIPGLFYAKTLPENTYIVAKCNANSLEIGKTFRMLYDKIIPESNYQINGYYDFEFYNNDFKGMDVENSFVEVYIPIIEK